MSYRTFLLAVHITSVAAWLGANFVQGVLSPRFAKERPELAAAWTRQQMWLGQRYYNVAGGAHRRLGRAPRARDAVGLGRPVRVGRHRGDRDRRRTGRGRFTPLARRRLAALEAGDVAAADEALARIMPLALLDTVLVLTAVVAMVHKWGV